jgi:hypothetical protein
MRKEPDMMTNNLIVTRRPTRRNTTFWLEPDPRRERDKRIADREKQEAEERADDEEREAAAREKPETQRNRVDP